MLLTQCLPAYGFMTLVAETAQQAVIEILTRPAFTSALQSFRQDVLCPEDFGRWHARHRFQAF